MEFNTLPEGSDKTQKRRTEFESTDQKLRYDAWNLIKMAEKLYGKKPTVRDALDLAEREDDNDLEALRKAIADATKNGPMTDIAESDNVENPWLNGFKARFEAHSELHPNIEWIDVEKTLKAHPEAMVKLQALDEKGHEMNVFREENGKIVFRTAQLDVTKMSAEHRTIMYDKKAQTDYPQYNVNGNAKDIAASMGVELATPELYEQLRVNNGWMWLETDAATRRAGDAFGGDRNGVRESIANLHGDRGSFCAVLRVEKA